MYGIYANIDWRYIDGIHVTNMTGDFCWWDPC